MESTSLVAISGSRLPEMLGNFQLDNHHVEEWSDPSLEPGHKHRARKEVGKWVNLEQNADIHYQKQEDSKHSDKSQERSRTEVIQGTAPDSTFQVVRSHRQYQDGDDRSGSKMQQTSSTSYHVSSSRGVRSTTKTTSNKTTTKTVTVSGGGRADDFENLRMSFTPLDTSTQRERITVSRSGTMGIRRPPTRRHTPAALLCSSPEDGPEAQRPDEGQILVDSDDNLRDTPDPDVGKMGEQSGMSIVGYKNISPKIRVGFPVEIQLELQNKLRSSSTLERESHQHHHHNEKIHQLEYDNNDNNNKETDSNNTLQTVLPLPLVVGLPSTINNSSRDSTFDFKDSKMSSSNLFTDQTMSSTKESQNNSLFTNALRSSMHQFHSRARDSEDPDRSTNRMSWDLLQNIRHNMNEQGSIKSKLYSTLSSGTSSGEEYNIPTHHHGTIVDDDDDVEFDFDNRRNSFTQRLSTINNVNSSSTNDTKKSVITLNATPREPLNFGSLEIGVDDHYNYEEDCKITSTPDVLHHDTSNNNSLSPSLERSRKLLKMLDETPDLINKMSFKSYFSSNATDKDESKDWDVEEAEKDDQMDWETQRQLSFLNDSLSRILDETRSIENLNLKGSDNGSKMKATYQNGHGSNEDLVPDVDLNGNFKEVSSKTIQVSQTWISSVDQKPAQTVRDNDVVTSISATNDAYKKTGPKKVEFCKTEVHFTPESGRFNIVETDENKPSTAHLFRKKKRSERKSQRNIEAQQTSFSSSSSSMSSLESTTTTTTEKRNSGETAYIVEMEVNTGNKQAEQQKPDHLQFSDENNRNTVVIEEVSSPTEPSPPSLLVLDAGSSSKSRKSEKSVLEDDNNHVFINLESIVNGHHDEYEDDVRSPSHMILSNYGEMKIQRYLKQLKSPSSREGSSSPLGSPTATKLHHGNNENDEDGHFRFDNILYENGSFVPLATRRSLIEMNNRNRKRLNGASQSSDNSSTTSTYSLPTSDRDQYSALRMGSMEATVTTSGSRPQITSVDFRYKNDNLNDVGDDGSSEGEKMDKMTSDIEYHNLSVKERRERFSSVPSPVLPSMYGVKMRHSSVISPTDSQISDINSGRPLSSTYISKKPPTPILPLQFTSFEKTGTELRERFYAKATNMTSNSNEATEVSNDPTYSSSVRRSEGKTKSVVTIGSTSNELVDHEGKSREMTVTTTTIDESADHEGEPVLSLDHTWKGPAHFDNQQEDTHILSNKTALAAARSLTFPKILRSEPEWVSKAKSRETRVTDWSLIEKQQTSTINRNTEPPWISEIRIRNKPTPNEELKSLPKISVVYPWQRDSSSKESSVERQDQEESHIVSIIPEPPFNGTEQREKERNDKRFGSYDLYSGKSLPPIKSLKSVPEVSMPTGKKNRSIVEVHSEPEHYISSPPKSNYSTHKSKDSMDGYTATATMTKTKSSSSSSKKASSMRVTTDTGTAAVSLNESRREAETFPKKSRKPLQVTQQQHKERSPRPEGLKQEEKYKTQPKPPKPPQRGTSLHREEANHSNHRESQSNHRESQSNHRDGTLQGAFTYREGNVSRSQTERSSSDTRVSTNHMNTSSKKTTSRRNKAIEVRDIPAAVLPTHSQHHQHQRETSPPHQPVIHRHPTIQITKLPMRTAKVSVVDGKRVSSSNNSSSNKSKSKHNATTTTIKGENSKPSTTTAMKSISKSNAPSTGRDQRRTQTTSSTKTQEISIQNSAIRGKPRRTGYQTPLKTSTRSPSLDLEVKKRKPNVGGGEYESKGDIKRK